MKKILYAAAECTPFIKTGGLGAVVGSLPKELGKKGHDIRVILPAYECIDEKWKNKMTKVVAFPVTLGWRTQTAVLKMLTYQGISFYFIENSFYFCGDSPYSDMWLDIEKFSFFDKAVLEALAYLDFEPDVIHCHDWQTGLIPVYLHTDYKENPFYQKIKTIMTIHNIKFQGMTEIGHMKDVTGLPDEVFTYDRMEHYGAGNMLKGGIAYADKITTVSKTYAEEITFPEYGEGLDALLRYRQKDLTGIVNGIDYQVYSPSVDEYIKYHYGLKNFGKAKKKNKVFLQNRVGLPADKNKLAICMITRLTEQKGLDILDGVMDRLLSQDVQLYILGNGEKRYEDMFSYYKEKYPDKLSVNFNYTDELAKLMYAGCDATLMPSRFEPCGLSQLMALRYGTVPIVRFTGGLKDTVEKYSMKYQTGTGFGFEEYDVEAFWKTLKEVIFIYYGRASEWAKMAVRGMQENYSWGASASEYEKLYDLI